MLNESTRIYVIRVDDILVKKVVSSLSKVRVIKKNMKDWVPKQHLPITWMIFLADIRLHRALTSP